MREALSTILSTLPGQFQSERAELLELLRRQAILYRTPTQPILSRDGTSARWMLDSLSVTLQPRGAELAGRCLLELLKHFDGRQIATYGLTAVPILQSCIMQSGGRYHGLLVRKERKKHGSLKLIEGRIDPREPIILIDDSISSGTSMVEACEHLKEAGLRVEGGIYLVRFGWYGGYALMQERGYHVEALYDIWDDFIYHMEDEQKPLLNPSKWFPKFEWSERSVPDGLHPAELARVVMAEYLSSGQLLRPPAQLDGEYDSAGGVWISVRSRSNIHLRHARDGFWHFPGEERVSTHEDLVLASLRTAYHLPAGQEGQDVLAASGLAVTFFPALERCHVGQLDNDRYGIVVRSKERPSWMGGALPRMPGIVGEWHQFQHARMKNGKLVSFEPFEIFRHDVIKAVESETTWQPTGVPLSEELRWHQEQSICGRIAERARDLVLAQLFEREETTQALAADLLPQKLDSIYLTVYLKGHLRGCRGTVVRSLDEDLRKLVRPTLEDDRFAEREVGLDASSVAVSVSLLFNPLELGYFTPEEVMARVRMGEQTLMAYKGKSMGLLLPFVASIYNLNSVGFAQAILDKASIKEPPYNWCRFDCVTWMADAEGASRLVGGFPLRPDEQSSPQDLKTRFAALHAQYMRRQLTPEGFLYLRYEPFQNRLYQGIELPRLAHAAWVLARAERLPEGRENQLAALKIVSYLSGIAAESEAGLWLEAGQTPSVSEISFLLLALLQLPPDDERRAQSGQLARTLWNCIDQHGRVQTHRPPAPSHDTYQDYFPGQALLALADAARAGIFEVDTEKLSRSFLYYRHRFRYQRHFGQVSWLMQAFARWCATTGDSRFADFVFEIGDWILEYQQEKTGAFINDHQPDTPGYTTALYLEGIGAALGLANALGDASRQDMFLESFTRGLRFLDRLIIQTRDASVLPNPAFAIGGLRQSLHRSEVRVDFVQHSLSALLEFPEDVLQKTRRIESTRTRV